MNPVPLAIATLAVALTSFHATAGDLVAQEGSTSIRLTEAACNNQAVLLRIPVEARDKFRTASAVIDGQPYTACWGALPQAVYLIYEDGDEGLVPVSRLQVPVDV